MNARRWPLPIALGLAVIAINQSRLPVSPSATGGQVANCVNPKDIRSRDLDSSQNQAKGPALPESTRDCPPSFDWSQVESTDYRVYIKNLRNIGCPELTIRDIICADVHALFEKARKKASSESAQHYWHSSFRSALSTSPAMARLQHEERALLRELLGQDIPQWGDPTDTTDDASVLPLPASLKSKEHLLAEWRERHQAARDSILALTEERELTNEEWERLDMLAREERSELDGILTASDRVDYELRFSPSADLLREAIVGMEVTEEEFRQLFKLRLDYDHRLQSADESKSVDIDSEWNAFRQSVAQILGSERFSSFDARSNSGATTPP